MAHLLCTDQPQGPIAAWMQRSLLLTGDSCHTVAYAGALSAVQQGNFDDVVIDVDKLNAPLLSLLTQFWKNQASTPVWLASRVDGLSEQLLSRCLLSERRGARIQGGGVSLSPLSEISATGLMALRQVVET
jgi:hypothetical protein